MAYRLEYKAKTTEFVQQNVSFHLQKNYRRKSTNQKRKKNGKLDFINTINLCSSEDTVKKRERQDIARGKYSQYIYI